METFRLLLVKQFNFEIDACVRLTFGHLDIQVEVGVDVASLRLHELREADLAQGVPLNRQVLETLVQEQSLSQAEDAATLNSIVRQIQHLQRFRLNEQGGEHDDWGLLFADDALALEFFTAAEEVVSE